MKIFFRRRPKRDIINPILHELFDQRILHGGEGPSNS